MGHSLVAVSFCRRWWRFSIFGRGLHFSQPSHKNSRRNNGLMTPQPTLTWSMPPGQKFERAATAGPEEST
jgi:hypothetical protein